MLQGIGVSSGIGIGSALLVHTAQPKYLSSIASPQEEKNRLALALSHVVDKTYMLAQRLADQAGQAQADILLGQITIAQDPFLTAQIHEKIDEGLSAHQSVDMVCQMYAEMFSAMDDELMRLRSADFSDLGKRLVNELLGLTEQDLSALPPNTILVTKEITPSMFATLDCDHVSGILAETGGSTSHCAILSRAMQIPAVFGAPDATLSVHDGDTVVLDGDAGFVLFRPQPSVLAQYQSRRQHLLAEKADLRQYMGKSTMTADGRTLSLFCNIGTPHQLPSVLEVTGEGIGLFRTEFLFLDRAAPPSEEEQFHAYRQVLEGMEGREVIIRTLDIGGDKNIPCLPQNPEENPFLGLRGIRYCLTHEDIFLTQLRALVRASAYGNLKIMLPMISTLDELRRGRTLLCQVMSQLEQEHVPYKSDLKFGIMVETPAAVFLADRLAQEADFFSIGTNDLAQYVMAADRGNHSVTAIGTPFQPAVLRSIRHVIQTGHRAGIPVGMCGEATAHPSMIPLLLAMGLDEFSVSPSALLQTRKTISQWSSERAQAFCDGVFQCSTAEEVIDFFEKFN